MLLYLVFLLIGGADGWVAGRVSVRVLVVPLSPCE